MPWHCHWILQEVSLQSNPRGSASHHCPPSTWWLQIWFQLIVWPQGLNIPTCFFYIWNRSVKATWVQNCAYLGSSTSLGFSERVSLEFSFWYRVHTKIQNQEVETALKMKPKVGMLTPRFKISLFPVGRAGLGAEKAIAAMKGPIGKLTMFGNASVLSSSVIMFPVLLVINRWLSSWPQIGKCVAWWSWVVFWTLSLYLGPKCSISVGQNDMKKKTPRKWLTFRRKLLLNLLLVFEPRAHPHPQVRHVFFCKQGMSYVLPPCPTWHEQCVDSDTKLQCAAQSQLDANSSRYSLGSIAWCNVSSYRCEVCRCRCKTGRQDASLLKSATTWQGRWHTSWISWLLSNQAA